jgi:(p)ppGpp synthase/HD superfamily hydrolase
MLAKAYQIAANAFVGIKDKGGRPYFEHLMAVMFLLGDVDEEVKIIAILHDLIEDTKYTYAQLEADGFSARVIAGVKAMTKQRGQSYAEYKAAVMANHDAVLVKMADLTHNSDIRRIKEPGPKDLEKTMLYRAFYTELKEYRAQHGF